MRLALCQVLSKFKKRIETFADSLKKTINPIGGTFLSRLDIRELRTIAEGCISKFGFS